MRGGDDEDWAGWASGVAGLVTDGADFFGAGCGDEFSDLVADGSVGGLFADATSDGVVVVSIASSSRFNVGAS